MLYILWCAWEDAFPGQKFNKFHAAFCTARDYVHAYHMAGRVSEESNESFNAVLEKVKDLLKSMPTTVGRVGLINARAQGNLKSSVSEHKRKITDATTGRERGPYKQRAPTALRDGKLVSSAVDEVRYKGKVYFRLTNGMLLPEEWRDVYDWIVGKKAPETWRIAMSQSAPERMTDVDKASELFSPW